MHLGGLQAIKLVFDALKNIFLMTAASLGMSLFNPSLLYPFTIIVSEWISTINLQLSPTLARF